MKVAFRARALEEAVDAKGGYEAEAGLGDDFVRDLDRSLELLRDFPELGPRVNVRGARRLLLHRFPYAVFYRIRDDRIIVLAVFHVARDPTSLRRRLN